MKPERSILAFIQRRYLAIVAVGLALAGAGLAVAGFKVENSIESWVDQTDSRYLDYRALVHEFGDDASIHVVFRRSDLGPDKLPAYRALLDLIRQMPQVTRVFDPVDPFLLDIEHHGFEPDIESLRASRRQEKPGPLDVLISRDLDTLGVLVLLSQDVPDEHPRVLQAVRDGFGEIGIPVQLAGTAYVSQTIADALTRDITLVVSGLMTISILVMLFYTRNLFVVGSSFLGIVISIILCLAFATLLHIRLNLLSLVMFPLVFCVGLTTAIHLFSRTVQGRWQFEHAWLKVIRPSALAALTTAVGCLSFLFASQRVVRDMGPVILFGVVVTFIVTMLFVPAAYRLLARRWTYAPPRQRVLLKPIAILRRPVSIALLVLATLSAVLLPRITTEPDAIFFFPEDSELIRNYRSIEQALTGLLVVEMVVKSTDGAPVSSGAHLEQLQGFVARAGKLPGLTGVVSALPWLEASLDASLVPEDVFRAYVNADESGMRLSFRFRNVSDIPYAQSAEALRSQWAESGMHGLEMSLTGLVPLILDAQDALLRTQALIFPSIVLVMTLIFVLMTRSLKVLLAAGAANFLPLLLLLGAMAAFGIPVNSINLFVASVMIGVIVDDTIHLLHAWREAGSVDQALAEVGPALWVTSATMALAFGSMLISGLAPIVQFGLLSVVTLVAAYACDVYLLPWLLSFRWARA